MIEAGYPYELVGLLFYVFFLMMGRGRYARIYSLRSRVLAVVAAIVLIGCVPFRYATSPVGVECMIIAGIISVTSALADGIIARRPPT